jgi:hypothetical protein
MFTNLAILGAPPCWVSPKKPSCVLRLRHWWMRICTACGHWSWKTFPPQAGPRATGRPGQVPVPGTHPGVISGGSPYFTTIKGRYPLVMTNIAMEAMAHRNRWFTYLKWWFSMAMLNKQMVTFKFSYPQKDLTSIWTYLNTIWRYTPCGWGTVVLSSFFFWIAPSNVSCLLAAVFVCSWKRIMRWAMAIDCSIVQTMFTA